MFEQTYWCIGNAHEDDEMYLNCWFVDDYQTFATKEEALKAYAQQSFWGKCDLAKITIKVEREEL